MTEKRAGDVGEGERVRARGRYSRRSIALYVTRQPVTTDEGSVMLCGYSKRGDGSIWVIRLCDPDEIVSVVP